MMKESNEVRMGRYLSGEAGIGEREAFDKELESDPAFNEEFLIFQRIWVSVPVESKDLWDSDLAWQKFVNATQPVLSEKIRARSINLRWAIAAAILIAMGTFTLFWNQSKPVTYAYQEGKTNPVSLSDGSKIYLNKDASLDVYAFTHKKRRVTLHGEAFFEISPDAKRPFMVESGGTSTEVVGTSFIITQISDKTRIFVQNGKVIFRSLENKANAVALTAGEAAIFGGDQMQLVPNPSSNIIAWHTRQLIFDKNMSLAEILADASAYFDKKISLENESLKTCRIANFLSYSDPEINAVLKPLASFINGRLKVEGNQYTIQGGRCP